MFCWSRLQQNPQPALRFATYAGLVFSLLLVGCGGPDDQPELGTVTGTITNNGAPLADAWVEFHPEKGRLSVARTNEEGQYTLQYTIEAPGAKVGVHTVKIGRGGGQSAHSRGQSDERYRGRDAGRANARKQLFEKPDVQVDSGENTLNFEITEGNEYQGAPSVRRGRGRRPLRDR